MIRLHLRYNRTGEVRIVTDDYQQAWDQQAKFMWLEHNYGCDCNRRLFWLRTNGMDWNDAHRLCGDWRYTLLAVEDATGTHQVEDREIRP